MKIVIKRGDDEQQSYRAFSANGQPLPNQIGCEVDFREGTNDRAIVMVRMQVDDKLVKFAPSVEPEPPEG